MAFVGDLARKRSIASAALLFLLLVDEIEGLVFVAVGVLLGRPDLFLSVQDVLFPTVVMVSATVSVARNWRRAAPTTSGVETMAMLDAAALAARVGEPLVVASPVQPEPAPFISLYGLSRERTSRPGWRSAFR